MTRNRNSRGRHRRRRDQPADAVAQDQASQAVANGEQPESPPPANQHAPERPPQADRGPGRRAEAPRGPRTGPPEGGRPPRSGPGEQGQRSGGRGNRRRPQRRHQMAPTTSEILNPKAPVTGGDEPVVKRTLAELDGAEGPVLGCPMLSRTRIGLPFKGGKPAPRCSLAWALHSEREARYCMETHDLTQCWQAHPERLDEIRARLGEHTPEPVGD